MKNAGRRSVPLLVWLLGLAPVVSACGNETRAVIWPELEDDTLSFLLVRGGGSSADYGPFGPEGPDGALSLPESPGSELFVLTLDRTWVVDRHARIDEDALDQMRLRDRPSACRACETTCRSDRNDLLFQPIGREAQILVLREQMFEPAEDLESADLWLELPARWDCEDLATDEATYVATWTEEDRHNQIVRMENDVYLLVGSEVDTLTGPEINLRRGYFPGAVPWGDGHALVAARRNPLSGTGDLVEVDLSDGSIVRSQALPFNPNSLWRDERGVIIGGFQGEVATSTDGERFEIHQVGDFSALNQMSRVPGQTPEYFFGAGQGRVFRGDPWRSTDWLEINVTTEIDYAIKQVLEVAGEVTAEQPDGRWLWARSSDRGSFERSFDGSDWRPAQTEPAGQPAPCTQGVDACGFTRFPHVTPRAVPRNGGLLTVPKSCPRVLLAKPEHACVSSFAPRNGEAMESRGGMVEADGGVYVVVSDGVLFIPIPE